MKTDCKPKRLRKYHDKLETHLTSKSRVATPDWSIDLNRIVNGNGSFTVDQNTWSAPISMNQEPVGISEPEENRLTNDEAGKESINPAHNQCLGYHHRHISLHHAHHSFHGRWVRHRIPNSLTSILRIFQEGPILVCRDQVVLASIE